MTSSSISGDVSTLAAGRFSGDVFDIVAVDMDRKEELDEDLTGGREGGLIDPPNIAAAALTFEGVAISIGTGDVDADVDVVAFEGEVELRSGESGRSVISSIFDLESSSSPNSSSSSSFILGLVGVMVYDINN